MADQRPLAERIAELERWFDDHGEQQEKLSEQRQGEEEWADQQIAVLQRELDVTRFLYEREGAVVERLQDELTVALRRHQRLAETVAVREAKVVEAREARDVVRKRWVKIFRDHSGGDYRRKTRLLERLRARVTAQLRRRESGLVESPVVPKATEMVIKVPKRVGGVR